MICPESKCPELFSLPCCWSSCKPCNTSSEMQRLQAFATNSVIVITRLQVADVLALVRMHCAHTGKHAHQILVHILPLEQMLQRSLGIQLDARLIGLTLTPSIAPVAAEHDQVQVCRQKTRVLLMWRQEGVTALTFLVPEHCLEGMGGTIIVLLPASRLTAPQGELTADGSLCKAVSSSMTC